jgi:hypothetical protein
MGLILPHRTKVSSWCRQTRERADRVNVIWSTIVIFVVGIRLAPELRQRPRVRTDFLLCVAAVLGCLVYLTRMLLTGMLYFG